MYLPIIGSVAISYIFSVLYVLALHRQVLCWYVAHKQEVCVVYYVLERLKEGAFEVVHH